MKLFHVSKTLCLTVLIGATMTTAARADDWNRKTVVTFSGPVEIPGVHLVGWAVLPAGTYVFKILDSTSDRHIVQIFNKEETKVYATILAIPNYRLKATDKTVITFRERPAGQPEALRAWFYPGRNWGEEFVYTKTKAIELAKSENTPVLFAQVDIPAETTETIRSVDAPAVVELKKAPIMAVQPTGDEVVMEQVVTAPPAEAQAQVASEPELPKTASPMPLIALLGFTLLAGAFSIRAVANRLS